MKQSSEKPKGGPRPWEFPVASPESRAAARAQCERRGLLLEKEATVVITTGLPPYFGAPVIEPPDSVAYYKLPDGSRVELIRRFWEDNARGGLTIYIHQTWPDGSEYLNGTCRVESRSDLERLARRAEA
jgi:hypothetical protein